MDVVGSPGQISSWQITQITFSSSPLSQRAGNEIGSEASDIFNQSLSSYNNIFRVILAMIRLLRII